MDINHSSEIPTRGTSPPQDSTSQAVVCPSAAAEPCSVGSKISTKVKRPKVELKMFKDKLTNWIRFWDVFDSSVHSNLEHSDNDHFNYLHPLLKGSAIDALSSLSLFATNFTEAVAVLERKILAIISRW